VRQLLVFKQGMDSREVITRFESERQALALMDHPNIATVFDAGSTTDGRPFFVMEYVPGLPITRYCDERSLGNRERLELFVQVCQAMEHAHKRAVIHRDLKPSNVLVMEVEGKLLPTVIDFGIAKATNQGLTEKTLFTELGRLIGTPEYMSPEQASGDGQEVDATTDTSSPVCTKRSRVSLRQRCVAARLSEARRGIVRRRVAASCGGHVPSSCFRSGDRHPEGLVAVHCGRLPGDSSRASSPEALA
jgi:serine/threonine protein kinase